MNSMSSLPPIFSFFIKHSELELIPKLESITINRNKFCVSSDESDSEEVSTLKPKTAVTPTSSTTLRPTPLPPHLEDSTKFRKAYLSWLNLKDDNKPLIFGTVDVRKFSFATHENSITICF